MTYKDQLENRKNARKHAQHQNQQEQPAKLASRKKDLLAHLEENIRDLGVTLEMSPAARRGANIAWPTPPAARCTLGSRTRSSRRSGNMRRAHSLAKRSEYARFCARGGVGAERRDRCHVR